MRQNEKRKRAKQPTIQMIVPGGPSRSGPPAGPPAGDVVTPPQKLAFIDALRGLAALYVVVFHLSLITTPKAVPPEWLAHFIGSGGSGPMLFFIVSAFTLCLSMEARATGETEPLVNFYIRRLFRIAPLFYLWLVIYFVRDIWYYHDTHSVGEVAENAFFVFNLLPGQEDGYVWASWTIGVEMLFYAVFPQLFMYTRNIGIAVALCLLAMAMRVPFHAFCLRAMDHPTAELFYAHGIVFNAAIFLAGIIAYHLHKLIEPERARRHGVGLALAACFVAGLIWLCYDGAWASRTANVAFQTLIYAAFLLGLSLSPIKIFVNKITIFYGRISYSVYLSHATTVFFMSPLFAVIYTHTPYKTFAFGASVVLALAVITPLSLATYRFVEVPGNALGRALIQRAMASSGRRGLPPRHAIGQAPQV
jgi:peptidoglycan/LPS O-acetylase OafA/YrhL